MEFFSSPPFSQAVSAVRLRSALLLKTPFSLVLLHGEEFTSSSLLISKHNEFSRLFRINFWSNMPLMPISAKKLAQKESLLILLVVQTSVDQDCGSRLWTPMGSIQKSTHDENSSLKERLPAADLICAEYFSLF